MGGLFLLVFRSVCGVGFVLEAGRPLSRAVLGVIEGAPVWAEAWL